MARLPKRDCRRAVNRPDDASQKGRTTGASSKHALEAVSDALRMEVAGDEIRVVLVEPGAFRTSIWDDNQTAIARHDGSAYAAAYDREQAMLRLTQPLRCSFSGATQRASSTCAENLPLLRDRYGRRVAGEAIDEVDGAAERQGR
jgi:NAD(P)-dependent dehydrogenase (short-subunit alcohol dehydrogenase family)